RGTQSGLYRVSWTAAAKVTAGQPVGPAPPEMQLRKKLAALHATSSQSALGTIWPALGHPDHWVRTAARVALEQQPLDHWEERAFSETDMETLLTAMVAMARV